MSKINDTAQITLRPDADTSHESAADWYGSYGWHLSTDGAGDVALQACEYDWLDEDDEDATHRLMESDTRLSADEAAAIVERARGVRAAAEEICGLLHDAVDAYERGDVKAVREALDAAASLESDHGDAPATDALRSQLLVRAE